MSRALAWVAGSNEVCVSTIENTACERELSAFIWVAATVLDLLPSDMRSLMSFFLELKVWLKVRKVCNNNIQKRIGQPALKGSQRRVLALGARAPSDDASRWK